MSRLILDIDLTDAMYVAGFLRDACEEMRENLYPDDVETEIKISAIERFRDYVLSELCKLPLEEVRKAINETKGIYED